LNRTAARRLHRSKHDWGVAKVWLGEMAHAQIFVRCVMVNDLISCFFLWCFFYVLLMESILLP